MSQAKEALGSLPMRFEPNLSAAGSPVKFSAKAAGYRLSLTAREALLSFPERELAISLVNANPAPKIEGAGLLPATANYLLGSRRENWRTGVPQYSRVRYAGVYPGIDLVYYGNQNRLEYDFVLQPGADPRRIRVGFRGAGQLSLTAQGDLRLSFGGRELLQKKPVLYQETASGALREISGRYILLAKDRAGFEVGPYDRSRPLVIDPVLVYATYIGGSGDDSITCVKVDNAGIVYVAGYLGSNDLAGTSGSYQPADAGGEDVFVAKLDPSQSGANSLLYLTYIGGSGADIPTGMAIDGAGVVYLTGYTSSLNFPMAGNSFQKALAGGSGEDAFVLKLDPSQTGAAQLIYSTYLGGTSDDLAKGIDVDQSGVMYVTGATLSGDFPLTANTFQNARWGPEDGFVAEIDPSQPTAAATLVYSTFIGGENDDEANAIVAVAPGKVWITGGTLSSMFPIYGAAYQPAFAGLSDAFLAEFDLTQTGFNALLYSTYLGGSDYDEGEGLAVDAAGGILVTGITLSTDFPTTPNAVQLNQGGNGNAFLVRVDPSQIGAASLTYGTFLGGTQGDVGYSLAIDTSSDVLLTGYTLSPDFPVTADALQSTWGGGLNAFIAKLNLSAPPGQALVYSTYVGQSALTIGSAIAAAPNGGMVVVGSTGEPAFPVTSGAWQPSYGGGLSDGYVLVFGQAAQNSDPPSARPLSRVRQTVP